MKKQDKRQDDEAGKRTLKIVIMILIIIIIILLLLTSCSSLSFGKIGNIFNGSSSYKINNNAGEITKSYNKELKFVKKKGESFLDDVYKIEFTTDKIKTKEYKCTTSDAKIATCVVKGNYVKVYPKKSGKVTISVIAIENGIKYIGTHKLTIKAPNRSITLNSSNGTINLSQGKTINVYYDLNNLSGDIKVTSSNSKVATATAENGVLTITGHKNGKATITLTIKYKGKKYTVNYNVNVTSNGSSKPNDNKNSSNNKPNKDKDTSGGNGNSGGNNKPNKPDKPDKPSNPDDKKSDVNTLSSLSVNGFTLSPKFKPSTNIYDVTVKYDTESIKLSTSKTDNKSTVKYKIGNKTITDINNIKLESGVNTLEIIVTSESGKTNTYKVNIKKPVRKIVLNKDKTKIYIEDITTDIIYSIYDDDKITNDYDKNDISVSMPSNYKGNISISNKKISLTPSIDDIGKTFELSVKYLDKTDKINITVDTKNSYYINTNTDVYNFVYQNGTNQQSVIINTNIFNKDVSYEDIPGGIKLYNSKGYINITSSDLSVLKIKYNSDDNKDATSSVSILTDILSSGTANINISGEAYGKSLTPITVKVNIVEKYNIVIDALDGFYDSFTTKYELLLENGAKVNLADYVAYKVDKSGNCLYYELESYNTKSDGTGTRYELNDSITVSQDLTLYAIYKSTSKKIELEENSKMYLTEVDIFHNEEYYKKYNKDKVIYPGAHGSHTMYIKNNTDGNIKITNMNIEENTTCINNSGCINMGYIVKHTKFKDNNWNYWYGGNNSYKILNKDSNATKDYANGNNAITMPSTSNPIELVPGEEVTIALLWRWEEVDDNLDTEIGKIKQTQKYKITVSLDYTKTSQSCSTP